MTDKEYEYKIENWFDQFLEESINFEYKDGN